jgi:hypothetical protein
MLKACIVTHPFYNNNRLFDLNDKISNRDNCLYHFYELKQAFYEKGVDLSTSDINSINESDFVIYNEMPEILPHEDKINNSFLWIYESELIRPDNWDRHKHTYFKKIFTWNDDIVDNKKYFKFNFSQLMIKNINKDLSKKEKFCTLIAGNKMINHPLELYSKRVEAIKWFEKKYPDDFEFYGINWDNEYRYKDIRFMRKIYRIKPLQKFFPPAYSSYKGSIQSKKEILEKYKFSICYENARDIPGYITEKIFDCFFAGCIPVYWGANNIYDHIDQGCFIDRREFKNYESLYYYMKNMQDEEYMNYLKNIEKFLNSDKGYLFSSENFTKVNVKEILNN